MSRRVYVRLALVLWIPMSLFCAVGRCAQGGVEPVAPDPMTLIPADSLFCVRLNNLSGTMAKMDQFLTGVSPVGLSMLVPAQLARVLGGTEPNGINLAGDFAIFSPLPGGDVPDLSRIAVLVPVSDYARFVKGNPNVAPPDAEGISMIGKEQPAFAATNVAGYAMVTTASNRQALVEMKKSMAAPSVTPLAKRLSPEELKRAQTSPVWAYANIQILSKTYGPMIQAKLQEAKKSLEATPKQGPFASAQVSEVLDMYAGLLNTLMQQTQSMNLTLDPAPTAVRAGFVVAAVPNTEIAKTLQGSSRTLDKKLLPYTENGAIMNFLMSLDPASWNRLNDFVIDLLAKIAGKDPSSEDVRKLRQLRAQALNALDGNLVASLSADATVKPPFKVYYVMGVKDPQAFDQVLDQAPGIFESGLIPDLLKRVGLALQFELKRKAETYKDVPIDSVRLTLNATDPNSQQGKMLATVFGSGIEGRLAIVNNLLLYAIARDPAPTVHALIDQAKGDAAKPVPSEVQAAMQAIPGAEGYCCFATYNYLRLLQMAMAILPTPVPQTPVQSQSNIALAGKATGGNFNVELALPKQHVMEIMTVFLQMQQQKIKEQQQQQPQKQPEGQPSKQTPPGQT